jgi:hypothetical protein
MRVKILSGNQAGTIEDVSASEAENLIATGFAEAVPEPAPEPEAEPVPEPEPEAESESEPEPDSEVPARKNKPPAAGKRR